MSFDLVIRGGRVVDGSGMPGFQADVAIQAGRIARIGRVSEAARRVMRAHSERLAARWRNGQVDGAEHPIEH